MTTRDRSFGRVAGLIACLACVASFTPASAWAQDAAPAKRILVLHRDGVGTPARARFDAAFVTAVRETAVSVDLHLETIDTEQFDGEQLSRVTDYLAHKYSDRPIDVIVAVGDVALGFARDRRKLFGNPAIVAVVPDGSPREEWTGDVTGLRGGYAFATTIGLMRALRPDTQRVYVVYGSRDHEWPYQSEIEGLQQQYPAVSFEYLRDLPLASLVTQLASAPGGSAVLYVRQTMRDQAADVDALEALVKLNAASAVPVFSVFEPYIGHGVVGGSMWRFETDAGRLARLALRILNGERARDIAVAQITNTTMVDWRQLQRWNIAESRVPFGSELLFRQPTLFETYRGYVITGLGVCAAQLGLIVGLLVQRSRRRGAEGRLLKSEMQYRSLVETQSELICRFLPDSTLTFVNDAYCRFWAKSREELLGRKFLELIPEDARAAVAAQIAGLTSGSLTHEHQVTLPDGTTGWQHWLNEAIAGPDGRVLELQGMGHDITDQKRAEEMLVRSEARHSAMLRAIPDLVFVIGADGTYLDYHARDRTELYAPPETFIGKNIREVMPARLTAEFTQAIGNALSSGSGEPVVVEYQLTIAGELRSYETRIVACGRDRVLSIVRDMTDAERARAANHDLAGRLIASQEMERSRIARELHDDFSQKVALLNIEIGELAGVADAQEYALRLKRLNGQAGALASDVHQLAHQLHPSKLGTIGLRAAIQAICRDFSKQHGIRVKFTHDPLPDSIDPDVSLCLYRITQEALHNISRHSRAVGVLVELRDDGEALTLQVTDDGIGFDPSSGERVGLGLVSMRERVAFLGGTLQIESRSGHGTRIVAHAPLASRLRRSREIA